MMQAEQFFAYARERYEIFLAKEAGKPKPWTSDPILLSHRFCNIFREDDKVTRWFAVNVRESLKDDLCIVFATVAFRFFNTIETGEALLKADLLTNWDEDRARSALSGLKPLITGAYMVKTPLRKPKLEGLIEIMNNVWEDRSQLMNDLLHTNRLEVAHQRFMEYPWIGPFMAYEFVTDLRHTYLFQDADDIMTWANPGPGAMRGLNRIVNGDVTQSVSKDKMQKTMQELLSLSRGSNMWPAEWPKWEMREVEHTLCEFDKYSRAYTGEGTPKQRYQGL